jgi:hypothetical protein
MRLTCYDTKYIRIRFHTSLNSGPSNENYYMPDHYNILKVKGRGI